MSRPPIRRTRLTNTLPEPGAPSTNNSDHEISDYQGIHYTYINDEHLKFAAAGFSTYTLTYDALGRCMERTLSSGPTTYYVYDGDKPILEYDSSGASVGAKVYGKGVDEILERVAIGSDNQSHTYFLQQNHEGSVTLLTDINGNVLERYRYDAFGAPTIYSPTWTTLPATIYDNRFLFTGREYAATYRSIYNTAAFNFYEYRARAYSPTLGRFMSEDSKLFDAGDYNLFRYCHNDPEDLTDPMGTGWINAGEATPEREEYIYNRSMADAQWQGSDLMYASNTGGAISIGAAGQQLYQQARQEAQKISEGGENRSNAPQALYRPNVKALAPGLAPVDQYQMAYGKAGAERMGELTEGSLERL